MTLRQRACLAAMTLALLLVACGDDPETGVPDDPSADAPTDPVDTGDVGEAPDPPAFPTDDAGCPRHTETGTDIAWAPFFRWEGRTYLELVVADGDAPLEEDHLGAVATTTRCRLAGIIDDPRYVPQDGDASFLRRGTDLYEVAGFDPAFRLAARTDDGLVVFEADSVPDATTGSALLGELTDKVVAIGVVDAEDATTERGRITDPDEVARLVELAVTAPVDQDHRVAEEQPRHLVVFELRETPPVTRLLHVEDGVLGRGVRVPDAFVAAIEAAAG